MKDEILDFYDEEMTWLGIETRGNVHRHGLWHTKVERTDLVPHQQHYYRQVLAAIKELASVPSRQP